MTTHNIRDPLKNVISSRNAHTLSEKRELATKAYQTKIRQGAMSVLQPKCAHCSRKYVFQRVLSKKIVPILKHHGVSKAALFGSVVRGEAKKRSDIDILIKFGEKKSLLDLVRLQYVLEDELGKKVDLLTYDSLHPLLKNIILKEQKVIYEKKTSQGGMARNSGDARQTYSSLFWN